MESVLQNPAAPRRSSTRELISLLAQMVAGLVLLGLVVAILGYLFRAPIMELAHTFVHSFGFVGMGVGTFLADGIRFPIPPQFYMLASISADAPQVATLGSIAVGSILGGHVAFVLAKKASSFGFVRRRAERVAQKMSALLSRHGYRAIVIGSLLPVPYSLLCYLAGLNRLPYRMFAVLSVLRIPKLVAYYMLIRVGWLA
jgi:uncharacterized membrane protein YdjX (TVP38/TMEM64 family)